MTLTTLQTFKFINPQRMRRRVTVVVLCVCVCVCLSVTTKSAAYLVFTSQTKFYRVLYGVFNVFTVWLSLKTLCLRVLASFFGHCCLNSSLPGKLLTAKQASDDFFSTWKVYMVGYRPNNTTGSSMIIVHWQRGFLAISACYKMLTQHCTHDIAAHYAIACNVHFCGYSDSTVCKHLAVMLDS